MNVCPVRTSTALYMGKGDGKTKKPKKKKKNQRPPPSTTPSTSPSPSPQPQRVSNQINIPVRQQIAFAKQHRQAQQSSTQRFRRQRAPTYKRTKYRRTEADVQLAFAARGPQDPDWDVLTTNTTTGGAAPLVLVDGYNIIFQWARLKKHMVRGDTERARQLLVDDLESLRSLKGWRVECVFDGRRNPPPLGQQRSSNADGVVDNTVVSRSLSKYGVRIVYTGAAVEADTYMESRCAQAKTVTEGKLLTGSLIVATDDAMIRMAGANAGAHCMSADRLVTELKAVRKGIAYKVEVAVAQANGNVVRPEQLWGTSRKSPQNKCVVKNVAAERKKRKEERERDRIKAKQLLESNSSTDVGGVPEWAQLPNRTTWNNR